MPTIEEAIHTALECLQAKGFGKGGAVYDDLEQALKQLVNHGIADDRLEE